uniref:Uncharacterized protein n=1 Tax=Arundo donax TaxID=35708 RepID=A0A0A9BZ53_ARUDO
MQDKKKSRVFCENPTNLVQEKKQRSKCAGHGRRNSIQKTREYH